MTLVTRWPGAQVPATESFLRYLDAGLPRPGTKEAPPPVAATEAAPQAAPPASAAIAVQPLPVPGGPSVTVDPSALPPPAQGPRGPISDQALATLLGKPAESPVLAALPPGQMGAPAAAPLVAPLPGQKTVALLLPLSGQAASLGHAMQDAAMLAIFEMAGEDVVLRPYDTAGTPDGAAAAATRAVADGARLILGPLFAAEAREVSPIAAQAGIGVLAFSNDRSVAGGNLNIMGFLPEAQVIRVVAFARSKQIERFALIGPNNDYGAAVVNGLRAAIEAYGGELVDVQLYDPSSDDLNPPVRALAHYDGRRRAAIQQLQGKNDPASKAALRQLQDQISAEMGFDAVLVAESGARLRALAPLLPYYDIDPARIKVLGTGTWDEPGLGNEPALQGAWFAAAPPDARSEFDKRFEATFKRKPLRLASLAYDATALGAVVARGAGFTADAIRQPSGYAGVDGIFRLRGDGLIERGLAVLEVQPRGVKVIDPPPDSFAGTN
ncbi:MAG: penicillin-binding protein activator [Alphaproteobacteria bacterium]|nr:penicillin-binding protein activator [Alphaproteobacteria bacterium]